MKTKNSTWFEVTSKFLDCDESGCQHRRTEVCTVEAKSFREAEERITELYIRAEEFEVVRMKRAAYPTVIVTDLEEDKNFYVATVDTTIPADPPMAVKHEKTKYLIQAATIEQAHGQIRDYLSAVIADNVTIGMMKSRVVAVVERPKKDEKPKDDGSKQ